MDNIDQFIATCESCMIPDKMEIAEEGVGLTLLRIIILAFGATIVYADHKEKKSKKTDKINKDAYFKSIGIDPANEAEKSKYVESIVSNMKKDVLNSIEKCKSNREYNDTLDKKFNAFINSSSFKENYSKDIDKYKKYNYKLNPQIDEEKSSKDCRIYFTRNSFSDDNGFYFAVDISWRLYSDLSEGIIKAAKIKYADAINYKLVRIFQTSADDTPCGIDIEY